METTNKTMSNGLDLTTLNQIHDANSIIEKLVPGEILTVEHDGLKAAVVGGAILHPIDYNYGYGYYSTTSLLYLNMVGPAQAVRAIWAHLVQNKQSRRKHAYNSIRLSNGNRLSVEEGIRLRQISTVLPSGLLNMVLLHPGATSAGRGDPYYLVLPEAHEIPPSHFYPILNSQLEIPLHPDWAEWLWEDGLKQPSQRTIVQLESWGQCSAYSIHTKAHEETWKSIIKEHLGFEDKETDDE